MRRGRSHRHMWPRHATMFDDTPDVETDGNECHPNGAGSGES